MPPQNDKVKEKEEGVMEKIEEGNCKKCLGCNKLEDSSFKGDKECKCSKEIEYEERRRESWRIVRM